MVATEITRPADVVTLSYEELGAESPTILAKIEEGYGQNGLGIVTVSGVPNLLQLRQKILLLADKFASLPEEVKQKYADPLGGSAGAGWSCGVEFLEDGQPDTYKGSYFANPLHDVVTTDKSLQAQFPGYLTPNIWPEQELPELRSAFQEIGRLIIDVGIQLTKQCDRYVQSQNPKFEPSKLARVLKESVNHKGRLLHYFPAKQDSDASQAWCTQHTDHGSLTGLLSALYSKGGKETANPDPASGLYIRDRNGAAVKASIPADHIAYQMGEAMQVHSGGLLRATPHYVQTASGPSAVGVSRNTLAIFMQPRYDQDMDLPPNTVAENVGIGQWKEGISFGEFSELTIKKYYKK